jgi:hypothetical protein
MLGSASLSGWYVPSKAKYRQETDSNKYWEGKMKSTLKRRLKELEIAEREAIGSSTASDVFALGWPVSIGSDRARAPRGRCRAPAPAGKHGLSLGGGGVVLTEGSAALTSAGKGVLGTRIHTQSGLLDPKGRALRRC